VLLELLVLIYLSTELESISVNSRLVTGGGSHEHQHNHKHYLHVHMDHSFWDLASIRRRILRWWQPEYRSKEHENLRKAMARHAQPAFHHSQLLQRSMQQGRPQPPPLFQRDAYKEISDNQPLKNQMNPALSPLDNFYSRQHLPQVPFLIVGGSDGSGTRTFVQTLKELGVTMITESADTLDVHGEEMHVTDNENKQQIGWPPLVQMVLNATHSANYTLHDLPHSVQARAISALLELKSSLLRMGEETRMLDGKSQIEIAAGVQYGWKAPISMVLLPLLQQIFGPIKFLHVVRDGRDVALSDNQSPQEKYYNAFYGTTVEMSIKDAIGNRERAMQLWNDWNYQVWQWAQQQEQQSATQNSNLQQFDYMVMRTEDFISPVTRWEVLCQLAEFVGARLTPAQLCCISHQSIHDLGTSHSQRRNSLDKARPADAEDAKKVLARYGKWKAALKDDHEDQARLETIGAQALKTFGYLDATNDVQKQARRFLDISESVQHFKCPDEAQETTCFR